MEAFEGAVVDVDGDEAGSLERVDGGRTFRLISTIRLPTGVGPARVNNEGLSPSVGSSDEHRALLRQRADRVSPFPRRGSEEDRHASGRPVRGAGRVRAR